jgi:hypothetical protein
MHSNSALPTSKGHDHHEFELVLYTSTWPAMSTSAELAHQSAHQSKLYLSVATPPVATRQRAIAANNAAIKTHAF